MNGLLIGCVENALGVYSKGWPTEVELYRPTAKGRPAPPWSPCGDHRREAPGAQIRVAKHLRYLRSQLRAMAGRGANMAIAFVRLSMVARMRQPGRHLRNAVL